jgi:hypothetical protein
MIDDTIDDKRINEQTDKTFNIIMTVSNDTIKEFQEFLNKNYNIKGSMFGQAVKLITIKHSCNILLEELTKDNEYLKGLTKITDDIIKDVIGGMIIMKGGDNGS